LAAITAGEGPNVLFIHGVGLRAEAWSAQIDALAPTCRVVAADMPGHGNSMSLNAGAVLTDFTDALASTLDGPTIVIGHSFGAMIALDMATNYPNKVSGVVAMNAIFKREPSAKSAVIDRAESLDGLTMADPTKTLERWFGNSTSSQRTACGEWLTSVDPAGYRSAYRVFANEDGPSETGLQNMKCPLLFVTGDQEPNSTPDMSQNMAKIAGGRAEIITNAAHMLPMTHADQVNLILTDFIREVSD